MDDLYTEGANSKQELERKIEAKSFTPLLLHDRARRIM